MPPKTTTKTTTTTTRATRKTTRAALQAKEDNGEEVKVAEKREGEAESSGGSARGGKGSSGTRRRAPRGSDKPKSSGEEPDKKTRSAAGRARAKGPGAAAATATTGEKVGGGRKRGAAGRGTGKQTKATTSTKKAKMAGGAGRKRRQKAAPAAATEAATAKEEERGQGDGNSSEVTIETPPPPKKRKDEDTKSEAPVEETDRVVIAPPPSTVVKETRKHSKKAVRIAEPAVPMETDDVISHHSHSTVHGQVFVMGQGDMGQLGLGEEMMERKKPYPVGGALEGLRVSQVVCGGMHTVALTDQGTVFTWGCNDEGALGRTIKEGEEFTPGLVAGLEGVKIVQVSAGDSHTAALADSGKVYGWGMFRDCNGAFGFLPPPSPPTPSLSPHIVFFNPSNKALKIASGSDHMAIVTEHGDIYTFGCAEQGQLGRVPECFSSRGGRKGISFLLRPDIVRFKVKKGTEKLKFTDIFCGLYQTFAVTQKGAVYTWGLNNFGQLCTGDKENKFQPVLLKDGWIGGRGQGGVVGGAKNFGVASGSHHTVVCCGGEVLTCGRKEYGRLGLGKDCEEPSQPTLVEGLKGVKVVSVEAGGACSFVVTETGEVYSWGMGTNLQLGMTDEEDVWTPEKVTGKKIENRKILCLSVGGQHTALLVSGE